MSITLICAVAMGVGISLALARRRYSAPAEAMSRPAQADARARRAEEFNAAFQAYRDSEVPRDAPVYGRLTADAGVVLKSMGGNCPVQIDVEVDGHSGYFRARGTHWSFEVAQIDHFAPAADAHTLFKTEREYGEWPSAGWMPLEEALEFLEEGIAEFRAQQRA